MQLDQIQSARYDHKKNQRQNWTDVKNRLIKQSQSELYESENYQIFTYINNFITKLSIEKERLTDSSNISLGYNFKINIIVV